MEVMTIGFIGFSMTIGMGKGGLDDLTFKHLYQRLIPAIHPFSEPER